MGWAPQHLQACLMQYAAVPISDRTRDNSYVDLNEPPVSLSVFSGRRGITASPLRWFEDTFGFALGGVWVGVGNES